MVSRTPVTRRKRPSRKPASAPAKARPAQNAHLFMRAGVALVCLSIAAGIVTLTLLTGLTPITPTKQVITLLQFVNGALAVALVGAIAIQGVRLWRARRAGIAGARLHVRLVTLFSLVAAIPVVVVAVFASVTLDRGLDTLFSKSTRAIVDNAVIVAESHVRGYERVVTSELGALVNALAQPRVANIFKHGGKMFPEILNRLRFVTSFNVVFLTRENGVRLAGSFDKKRAVPKPPEWAIAQAKLSDTPYVIAPQRANLVLGIVKLKGYDDVYLQGYRYFDREVVDNLRKADQVRKQYVASEAERYELQVTFALISISVSLVFLLAAIWLGLRVADRLVAPIVRLMDAARRVSRGNLDSEVPVRESEGDLAALGLTFNRMTQQLRSQHAELTDANTKLDDRRRFIEAVLSGVSAGVIGLDAKGTITLANRSALALLRREESDLLGKKIERAVPEFKSVFLRTKRKSSGLVDSQVTITRDNTEHSFVVRVMKEKRSEEADFGFVLTFDDTTELVTAQRNSAWADIAQRIAHEIKNPLTPIQLSAERLRRRYSDKIADDTGIFEQCTQTIIRQVGDIGRMVDEFSSFARMPSATIERADLTEVVKEGVLLQRVSQSDITFDLALPDQPVIFDFDRRLVTQAITNLVKNATEAIEAKISQRRTHKGRIHVAIEVKPDTTCLIVEDNGIGLPEDNRARLLEPYMTTREKGTGLGLAIVKRIMEEHGGKVVLRDAHAGKKGQTGAQVRLEFPANTKSDRGEVRAHGGSKRTVRERVPTAAAAK